jgi:hypothetical protein
MTRTSRQVAVYSIVVMFTGMRDTVISSLNAQEPVVNPNRLSPVLTTTEVYDSNLFSSPTVTSGDFITRVSPGVDGEYRSPRFSVLGRYVFDLERFAAHPELTTADGGQHASIGLRTSRSRRLTFAVDASVQRTRTPGELSAGTGLTLGRAPAERVEVHPEIVRQVNPLTVATVDYAWTDERLAGGIAGRTHRAAIKIDRHVSRRDVVDVNYGVRMFSFDADRLIAHAVSIGWSRQISREAHLELRGGPVLTEGKQAAEALASIRYRPGPSELSISYARTQTTLIGFAGIVETQSITASAARMLPKRVQIRITPGVFRTIGDAASGAAVSQPSTTKADAGRLAFEAERPMTDRLSWLATYEAMFQRGSLTTAPFANSISRHLVQFSVVAAPARRRPDGR